MSEKISLNEYHALGMLHGKSQTEFFRYGGSLTKVFNQLEKWKQSGKQAINLLSLPCSIGLEPLTLVGLALQAGYAPENIHAVGVDINSVLIEFAKRGEYWTHLSASGLRINFPLRPAWTNFNNEQLGLDVARQVFSLPDGLKDQPEGNFPIKVKPAVLDRITYLIGDVRNFRSEFLFDVMVMTAINADFVLIGNDICQIGKTITSLLGHGGLLVSQEIFLPPDVQRLFKQVSLADPQEDYKIVRVFIRKEIAEGEFAPVSGRPDRG